MADTLYMLIGSAIALFLLGVGGLLGYRLARRKNQTFQSAINQEDRERVLQLLQELAVWTSEYSGNVSDYQEKLGQLSSAVQDESANGNRVVVLLSQIMQSNEHLQSRLDAAEKQLEKQTQQIESYLTEARTDGLTGLSNRRSFDQCLEELFNGYRNGGKTFVLALVDIDHFKAINDTHGHQVGDKVLQQIAKFLRNYLSEAAMVARFGGEEFAVIMDGPLRVAAERMNDLRKALTQEQMQAEATQLEVTISIGLSEPRDDLVPGPVVRRADESLYAAKKIGRNRVYYHDGRAPTLLGAPETSQR